MKIKCSLIALTAALTFYAPAIGKESVFTNGKIYTMNENNPWADTIVVDGNKITFVGRKKDALAVISGEASIIDLKGQFVMPAIIDGHTHPGLVALLGESADEEKLPTTSKQEMYDWMREYAKVNLDIPFIVLGEWNLNFFELKGPHKSDLDEIFPHRPAMIFDSSGHSIWLNSAALEAFNITKNTPDLSENISYFVKDDQGEPTGWVKEFALMPYMEEFLIRDLKVTKERLKNYVDFLASRGVTTLLDAGNFGVYHHIYNAVSELDKEGNLPLRYEGSYHIYSPQQLDIAVSELLALRKKYGGKRLTFSTIKIHYDGVAEINTAGMLEPFFNEPDNSGGILFTKDQLVTLMKELAVHDLNLHMHVVGDRATRIALDAVEKMRELNKGALPLEVTLAHLETVAPEDIKRFIKLGVHANFTPHWLGGGVFIGGDEGLGEERKYRSQMVKSFLDAGANVTFSSDVVSLSESKRADPFLGMQIGATRQEPAGGIDAEIFMPKTERVSIGQMIKGYTINAAHQLGLESKLGSIEAGKQADFIVLDKNPFAISIYEIKNINVTSVVMDGLIKNQTK